MSDKQERCAINVKAAHHGGDAAATEESTTTIGTHLRTTRWRRVASPPRYVIPVRFCVLLLLLFLRNVSAWNDNRYRTTQYCAWSGLSVTQALTLAQGAKCLIP